MISARTALCLVVLGQCLDTLTFVTFYKIAPPIMGSTERNDLVLSIMLTYGIAGVVIMKVGLAGLALFIGTRPSSARVRRASVRRATLTLRNALLVAAVAEGFIGAAFNSAAILQVTG
jgi:hypothetical protein